MRLSSTTLSGDRTVDDATSLALSIDEVIGEYIREFAEEQHSTYRDGLKLIAAGALTIIFAYVVIGGVWVAMVGAAIGGKGLVDLKRARDERPEIRVTGARKRYWTGYAFPRGEGTLLFDATDTASHTEFNLERLDDPDALAQAHNELTKIDRFPTVIDPGDNVEEDIVRHLGNVHNELANTEELTLSAPVIEGDNPLVEGLERIEPAMSDGGVDLDPEYELDEAAEIVDTIEDLEQLAFETDPGEQLRELKESADETVTHVVETQSDAIETLNDHIETAGDLLATTTYKFYCPVCQIDEVESQLEGTLSDGAEWHCPTCTNTFTEGVIIPKHRMKDEVIEDVWDQLWIEKDDERRRIYESIEDQKTELGEREYEQRREEIRTASGRIKDRRAKLRDLQTRARAGKGKIDEIGDLMVKYRGLAEQRKNKFRTEVNQKAEEIDRRTSELIEETRNVEQERLEQAEQQAQANAQMLRAEQERRHREKMAAQEQLIDVAQQNLEANEAAAEFAYESAKANRVGAEASVRNLQASKHQKQLLESMEDIDKKQHIMDVRGSVNPIPAINKGHMMAKRATGMSRAKQN